MRPVAHTPRVLALLLGCLLISPLALAGPKGPPMEASLIVGFDGPVDAGALAAAKVRLLAQSDGLGLAIVSTPAPAQAAKALLAHNPHVAFVVPNGVIRADASTWDASTWDASTWDASTWDASRWDGSTWDASTWDASTWDASTWDSTGWDASTWDASTWDASRWDASTWDASTWDSTGWDASTWDASTWDASRWDASTWDASTWDASRWDASRWDASTWDASRWDASRWDASRWDASTWDSDNLTAEGRGEPGTGASDPLLDKQWGLRALNFTGAFHTFQARDTQDVCIVDSGIDYAHPDLAARMWRDPATGAFGHDFVNGDSDPMDDAGHGTHVAGIAAAAIGNGIGIAGASPSRLMAAKVLGTDGSGTEADLALAIEWCVDHGADVVSMSLGTPEDSPAVYRAVRYAYDHGVALVASIGNQGGCGTCVRFPAAYGEVAAVGAIQPDGQVPTFSSVSNAVDFAAPGVVIVSTLPGDRYAAFNGTSFATPHVAAAVALLMDAQPALDAISALRLLAVTAQDLGPDGRDDYTGYGAPNVGRALDRAMEAEQD